MRYCPLCPCRARCARGVRLVSDRELSNPEFVRDVRDFGFGLSKRPSEWLDFVLELFARFEGCVIDDGGHPVRLNTEIFLPTDKQISDGVGAVIEYRMRNWFEETFATPVRANVVPRVRCEARERLRVVATILRARFSIEGMMWGVRPANDNTLIPSTAPGPRA